MNEVDFLWRETQDTYQWTHKLIDSIPFENWDETPEVIATNVTWQVGHLIMSHYFHAIVTISGHPADLVGIPLRDYAALFSFEGTPKNAVGKTQPEMLRRHLEIMQQKSLEILEALTPEDLKNPLEPTQVKHPIAKVKYEALAWNIKHTMWHCGQLGLLKRIINGRYDFGLRR